MLDPHVNQQIDINNTEIAFSSKTNAQLNKALMLFKMMSHPMLVKIGSKLGLISIKAKIPGVRTIVKNTIFDHFCGGETLADCQNNIDLLAKYNVLTILDYGAESKSKEYELDKVMNETLKAIEFSATNSSVPVVSTKPSGLGDNDILIAKQNKAKLTDNEQVLYEKFKYRLDTMCQRAHQLGVGLYIDAEESWIQNSIDEVVDEMMEKYNKEKIIVHNTFQLYRTDRLAFLKASHQKAIDNNYHLGAKLVRGAYMIKERLRAQEMDYKSPIHSNKEATDNDYNNAIRFCVENYQTISSCNASHNLESNLLQAELIDKDNIQKNHPHLNFCQLYGMADFITFNIANAGYNAAKYLPYGAIKEVVPYLIRRAQENTSITGEVGRELRFLKKEIDRRKL